MNELSLALRQFNDKVRMMNQVNAKQLMLTAHEARSMHSDIFTLLATIAELAGEIEQPEVTQITMDGGRF